MVNKKYNEKRNCCNWGRINRPGHSPAVTGSDFLMGGGVTAAYWYGELAPEPE